MNTRIILTVICWFVLGLVGAGFSNAYFQRKWDNQCHGRSDHAKSIMMIFAGPVNLIISFLFTGYGEYGWSLSIYANPKCQSDLTIGKENTFVRPDTTVPISGLNYSK